MDDMKDRPVSGGHRIIVAGIGPGHPDYIVSAAKRAIEQAEVLVGGRRALSQFGHESQEQMAVAGDIPAVMAFIRKQIETRDVTVMVSGDPGYFSLLDALRREFPADLLRVIPGISAMQMAFSACALPWHGARLMSFHGRVPEPKEFRYERGAVLGMLTDGEYDSHRIPKLLMEAGWPEDTGLIVCARLSYEDEKITETTLRGALLSEPVKHGILIVRDLKEIT